MTFDEGPVCQSGDDRGKSREKAPTRGDAQPSEDEDDSPKLASPDTLHCDGIGRESLDEIVEQVKDWYTRLASVILKAE